MGYWHYLLQLTHGFYIYLNDSAMDAVSDQGFQLNQCSLNKKSGHLSCFKTQPTKTKTKTKQKTNQPTKENTRYSSEVTPERHFCIAECYPWLRMCLRAWSAFSPSKVAFAGCNLLIRTKQFRRELKTAQKWRRHFPEFTVFPFATLYHEFSYKTYLKLAM